MKNEINNEEPKQIFLTYKEFQKYLRKDKRGDFYCKKCGELTDSREKNTSTVHLLCRDCNLDRLDFGL